MKTRRNILFFSLEMRKHPPTLRMKIIIMITFERKKFSGEEKSVIPKIALWKLFYNDSRCRERNLYSYFLCSRNSLFSFLGLFFFVAGQAMLLIYDFINFSTRNIKKVSLPCFTRESAHKGQQKLLNNSLSLISSQISLH